jgi:CTP synthase (UTP-ammonia lyase)
MDQKIKIGIIGEFLPERPSHNATNQALNHAAGALSMNLDDLVNFDALWCAPGGLYKSKIGTIRAIQFAREKGWPFIGT